MHPDEVETNRQSFWDGQPVTAVRARASTLGIKFRKPGGFKNKQELITEIIAKEPSQEAAAADAQGACF